MVQSIVESANGFSEISIEFMGPLDPSTMPSINWNTDNDQPRPTRHSSSALQTSPPDSASAGTAALEQPLIAVRAATPATLGGSIWHDANADELQGADELTIAGVAVTLVRDANGAGRTPVEGGLATTTTDAGGNYAFEGLDAGRGYQVHFGTPGGYDASLTSLVSDPVELRAGEDNRNLDIGFFKYASLGDRVWNDRNGDGVQDAGETGRAGVKVELYLAVHGTVGGFATSGATALDTDVVMLGELLATELTDGNGNYRFANLVPGEYILRFVAPDGTVLSTANASTDDAVDSDADVATGLTGVYKLASGESNTSADAGLKPSQTIAVGDQVEVCEDRSTTFDVLANDVGVGLKLIKVAHESTALDNTFKARGGALSFTADGLVTYQSMKNYYGVDKLVYTLQDASGKQYTQTVEIAVDAVSDAPTVIGGGGTYHWDYDGGWQFYGVMDGKTTWIHDYSAKTFGTFSDAADAMQDFGGYNKAAGVSSDADSLKVIRIYGISQNAAYGTVLFDGQPVDFSNGKTLDVTIDDIKAGRLDLKIARAYTPIKLDWTYVDTGDVQNGSCCTGSVESNKSWTTIVTPLALDLSGDGKIGVTGATSSSQKDAGAELGRTVRFDIDADGKLDLIEWFDGSGDGILVDNRDGLAATQMNGARLFGTDDGAFANGYDKLANLDINSDGKLSSNELAGLMLWVDNGDAQVQDGELQTLGRHGIASISTQLSVLVDAEGRGHLQSTATRADGTTVMSEDVFFAQAIELPAAQDVLGSGAAQLDALLGAGLAAAGAAAPVLSSDIGDVSQAAEALRKIATALSGEALVA